MGAENAAGARNAAVVLAEAEAEPAARIITVAVSSPTPPPPGGGLGCGSGGGAGAGDGRKGGGSLVGARPIPALEETAGTLRAAYERGVAQVVRVGAAPDGTEPARKSYPGMIMAIV